MKICLALTKGRLETQCLDYLKQLSFDVDPLIEKGRRLCVETDQFKVFFAKGVDVATYVENGIADLGIVGEDILMEYQPDVYNLLPLPFGKCRMALAGIPKEKELNRKYRIATKYPKIARDFFQEKGESVDLVKLEGSVELAPLLGLADDIVDIVETGTTLKENGLVVKEEITTFTARCIANRSSLKVKRSVIMPFVESLGKVAAL
ncbi:ATP phosphoribosyltransferase [Pullulanibacillus pueri]|uniref:ATP phosphoribosyltransferase n=1 Tax=Pullulanibacillus pueri TaxID=1437324 RepID=A0A8J3EKD0_9BACL|nr:ATP phosphoribosyltransferase [Pullulanibacillus pueri]MBM7681077.1 ATP phosphoribosyltransferase [Pullulanibacillus pueri]GGH76957.1 ATP phosphoribosyltransferase [Pullulanibacillus pueri]